MMGRSHMLFGVTGLILGEIAAYSTGYTLPEVARIADIRLPEGLVLAAVTAVGALAPDIDHPSGLISRFKIGKGRLAYRPLESVAFVASHVAGHRKFFHSILATIMMFFLASYAFGELVSSLQLPIVPLHLTAAFIWGYVSHLISDSLTRSGVPWLYVPFVPFTHVAYGPPKSMRFTTGTFMEYLVVFGFAGFTVALAYMREVPWTYFLGLGA